MRHHLNTLLILLGLTSGLLLAAPLRANPLQTTGLQEQRPAAKDAVTAQRRPCDKALRLIIAADFDRFLPPAKSKQADKARIAQSKARPLPAAIRSKHPDA